MTCYRVNWKLTSKELDPIMEWLDANREALGLIRGPAWGGEENPDGETLWYTKFIFKTEEGARMFYRRWQPDFSEDTILKPWGGA